MLSKLSIGVVLAWLGTPLYGLLVVYLIYQGQILSALFLSTTTLMLNICTSLIFVLAVETFNNWTVDTREGVEIISLGQISIYRVAGGQLEAQYLICRGVPKDLQQAVKLTKNILLARD